MPVHSHHLNFSALAIGVMALAINLLRQVPHKAGLV